MSSTNAQLDLLQDSASGEWMLPSIESSHRIIPINVAKSGIFKADISSATSIESAVVYRDDTNQVIYTGDLLDQDEFDIFLTVLKKNTSGMLGDSRRYRVSKTAFLQELGWSNSGANHARLERSLIRLTKALFVQQSIDHESEETKRSIPMRMFSYEMFENHIDLWVSDESIQLFEKVSTIDWDKRKQIESRHNLAKALQGLMSGYPELMSFEYQFDDLRVTGVKSPDRHFAVALDRAFNELVRVGIVKDFLIEKRNDKKWWASWTLS